MKRFILFVICSLYKGNSYNFYQTRIIPFMHLYASTKLKLYILYIYRQQFKKKKKTE